MSTSLLYHAFGIRGYRYVRTDYRGGEVFFTISQDLETCRCSACDAGAVRPRGGVERRFRALPIGSRPTTIILLVPRVQCLVCGVVRHVEITFADPRRGYTRSFERYTLELSRRMTIRDVVSQLGVGWDVIKDIQKRDLMRRFAKPRLKDISVMAIDEIAVAEGHRYLTLVMDLDSGVVKFVGDGKGADALKPSWKRLRPSGAKIEAVAMDMSGAYQAAVRVYLPKAKIVFDHFHVVQLFNEKPSELRRALYREATYVQHKEVLKGTRWLLLKNPEKLDEGKDEKHRLEEALKLNQPLATAYLSPKFDLQNTHTDFIKPTFRTSHSQFRGISSRLSTCMVERIPALWATGRHRFHRGRAGPVIQSNRAAIIERAETIHHSSRINFRAEAASRRAGNELSATTASRAGTADFADGPSCPRLFAAIL